MTRHNQRRPCVLTDSEPAIAIVDVMRWERENLNQQRKLIMPEHMAEARAMRAAYQRELLRRFAGMVVSFFYRPRAAEASAIGRHTRR